MSTKNRFAQLHGAHSSPFHDAHITQLHTLKKTACRTLKSALPIASARFRRLHWATKMTGQKGAWVFSTNYDP